MYIYTQTDLIPPGGKNREWLLTNGLGGFAASTISGINTRRYHGLLIAALNPPVDRRLMLGSIEVEISVEDRNYKLFSLQTKNGYTGEGFNWLTEFRRFPFPTYVYQVEDVSLEKEIMMVAGENTVMIRYRVFNPHGREIRIRAYPLVTCRDFHWTVRASGWPINVTPVSGGVLIQAYEGAPELFIGSDKASWQPAGFWHYDLFYEQEAERGLDSVEDQYCPVSFSINCHGSEEEFWIAAGTERREINIIQAQELRRQELKRLAELSQRSCWANDDYFHILNWAADSFLVRKAADGGVSVIAGYPWFADWGRDAMIALPGLTLATGRFRECKEALRNFIKHENRGIIPNLFSDHKGEPAYNTVDASLWLFWCIYKYLQYTGDKEFVLEECFPALAQIARNYIRGTFFGIGIDEDGLIAQGEPGKALTWMDACIDGRPVTPRTGKPVEVNALWIFALSFLRVLAQVRGEQGTAREYEALAAQVRESFVDKFWNEESGYLYDLVNGSYRDHSIRCNQIMALSLPVAILDQRQAARVLNVVGRHLYTPYGLRTLAPGHQQYRGRYRGNQKERDESYHQGTVWVWPWGHFLTAYARLKGLRPEVRSEVRRMMAPMLAHLSTYGLGQVAEIFDGDPPHHPRGCFSQAWSTAEVLRIYYEIVLTGLADLTLNGQG